MFFLPFLVKWSKNLFYMKNSVICFEFFLDHSDLDQTIESRFLYFFLQFFNSEKNLKKILCNLTSVWIMHTKFHVSMMILCREMTCQSWTCSRGGAPGALHPEWHSALTDAASHVAQVRYSSFMVLGTVLLLKPAVK